MSTKEIIHMTLDLDSIALDSSPVIAAFLHTWNDTLPDDERQQLERYAPLVVGTNRGPELDDRLAWMATDWLVRVQVPAWLRLAGLTGQAEVLEGLPEVTPASAPSIEGALEAVRKDAAAARAAAWDAARAVAWAAAWDAAWAAASDATRAAARAVAWTAARAATRDATRDAATDVACAAAWDVACAAAWDVACAAATAAGTAARDTGTAMDAATAARDAARAAATAALDPTTRALQASAHDLLDRMITVASEEH